MVSKSYVAGILSIVAGAWGFLYALFAMIYGAFIVMIFRQIPVTNGPPAELSYVIAVFAGLYALFFAALGALAVIGGIYSIKKMHWGIALAGAIAGTMTFMPVGLIAVIFVSMAKSDFVSSKPLTPAPLPVQSVGPGATPQA